MYGTEGVWMSSACIWASAIPAVPEARIVKRRGHCRAAIQRLTWDNPRTYRRTHARSAFGNFRNPATLNRRAFASKFMNFCLAHNNLGILLSDDERMWHSRPGCVFFVFPRHVGHSRRQPIALRNGRKLVLPPIASAFSSHKTQLDGCVTFFPTFCLENPRFFVLLCFNGPQAMYRAETPF